MFWNVQNRVTCFAFSHWKRWRGRPLYGMWEGPQIWDFPQRFPVAGCIRLEKSQAGGNPDANPEYIRPMDAAIEGVFALVSLFWNNAGLPAGSF